MSETITPEEAKDIEDLIQGLKALLECAEKSRVWLALALTIRQDYEELMQLAEDNTESPD